MSDDVLQRRSSKVPVTALAFFNNDVLLAGEGNILLAYDATTRQRVGSAKIFRQQAIHGIFADEATGLLLIYGGRRIAVASLRHYADNITFSVSEERDTGDWILDATFSPFTDTDEGLWFVLVTAHNALATCEVSVVDDREPLAHIESTSELVPGSNCLLYCAHILEISPSHCLIASGTAFGDVILWSCMFPQSERDPVTTQVHCNFSAHEGSIFGVHISDDRNVKLWNISTITDCTPANVAAAIDTGFGATKQSNENAPPLIAAALGHVSRIWSVRTLVTNDRLAIWTFGEDATRIDWHIERHPASGKYQLEQSRVDTCHTGKNIWSTARTSLLEDTCATGGADGSISVLPDNELHGPMRGTVIVSSQIHAARDRALDPTKSYAFIAHDSLIAVSAQGYVTLVTLRANGTSTTDSLACHEELRSYSLVTALEGTAAVAGKGGDVYMYDAAARQLSVVASVPGKVAGLFMSAIRTGDSAMRARRYVLVTTLGSPDAQLVEILATQLVDDAAATHSRLQLPKGFVVTSFGMSQRGADGFIVLGSRNGAITVYDLSSQGPEPLRPCFDRAGLHSDAITSLCYETPNNTSELRYIFASSRDGTYSVHSATFQTEGFSLGVVHKASLSFGPSIEGLSITECGQLQVWGFKSKHFALHDVTSQEDLMKVECGGVHSSWAFDPTDEGGTFAWTEAGNVTWTMRTQKQVQRINTGGHGREIKACAVSQGSPKLIATGAEDTNIKLFKYDESRGFQCLQTLRKHVTGIQHLQWSSDGTWLFSSGGFEEFFAWKITKDVPYINVGVVCAARHPRNGKSDLRIMGFDVRQALLEDRDGAVDFNIMMAYSDSTLKIWSFSTHSPDAWTLVAQGSYLTSCLSSVYTLPSSEANATILTTSTDGHLALWSTIPAKGTILEWASRHSVHQNAILSSTLYTLPDSSTLVVTGGDDNALAFTRITDLAAATPSMKTLIVPRAHAAAITGIVCRATADNSVLEVVSVGLDQKVKIWRVLVEEGRVGLDGLEVRRTGKSWSCVADAGKMVWLGGRSNASGNGEHSADAGLLVVGVGMEVWSLDVESGRTTPGQKAQNA
ncbi:WD repeat-containing protein 6 [Oleoguttula sp. CCFEE 5521]